MNNINLTFDEEMFLNRLSYGIMRAKTAREIGLDPRTIRSYVEALRQKGVPICSHNCGYWIAENKEETRPTISRLRTMGNNTLDIADALENCFN